jgi:uncharacterized protein
MIAVPDSVHDSIRQLRTSWPASFVDANFYVLEPADLWTEAFRGSKWAGQAPRLEPGDEGDRWVVADAAVPIGELVDIGATVASPGTPVTRWDQVTETVLDPVQTRASLRTDGISHAVCYPTLAYPLSQSSRRGEPEFELECARVYNDWLLDVWVKEWAGYIPQCILPPGPIEAVVAEAERCIGRGHKGVIFPSMPMLLGDLPHINEQYYFPLWSLCAEAGVPVCFRAGDTSRTQLPAFRGASDRVKGAIAAITGPASGIQVLANFLFSPIPSNFEKLKVVFAGSSLGWAAYILETAEHQFERQRLAQEGYPASITEIFRRQCYLTGWYDRDALGLINYLGPQTVLWSTQFPRTTSSWPSSRTFIARWLSDVSEADADAAIRRNALDLYGIGQA